MKNLERFKKQNNFCWRKLLWKWSPTSWVSHETGLKKQAAVVKHTWLLSPHCSLTFTAEGQKSYTATRWALWSTSTLPFPALHLPFLIKIAKIITLTSSVPTRVDSKYFLREAPWLQWELHYLSGLIDDARSRKVIWMEITVAESHYLEDKQSNKSASVLLTQCGTWQGQTDFSGSSSRSNRDTRHVPRVDKSCMIWVEQCESSLRQDLVTAGLERIDTFQNLNKRQKQRWFSYFTSR